MKTILQTIAFVWLILLCLLRSVIVFGQTTESKNTTETQAAAPPLVQFNRTVPANTTSTVEIQLSGCQAPLGAACTLPSGVQVLVCGVPVPITSISNLTNYSNISIVIPGSVVPQANVTCDVQIIIPLPDGTTTSLYATIRTARQIYWLHGLSEETASFWGASKWTNSLNVTPNGYAPFIDNDRLSLRKIIDYPTSTRSDGLLTSVQSEFGITNSSIVPTIKEVGLKILQSPNPNINITQPEVPTGSLPIAITHSMGGLVARSMARELTVNGGRDRIGGIITVGTPNQGAPVVHSVQSGIVGAAGDAAIRELGAGAGIVLATPILGQATATFVLACSFPGIPPPDPLGQTIQTLISVAGPLAAPGIGALLTLNGLLPVNPLAQFLITTIVSNSFGTNRPNVQDMYVIPDLIGGSTGQGAPAFSAPFMNEINSIIPSRGSVNAVPVINIFGSTSHEQPQYSIGSTALEVSPFGLSSLPQLLCEPVGLKPQYLPTVAANSAEPTKDKLVPNAIYQKVKPVYVASTGLMAGIGAVAAITGALPVAVAAFTASAMFARGWRYIDFGAQAAYNKIIGATRQIPLVNTTIFGFRLVVLTGAEEYLPSDAFIPEWSQKSSGAFRQFEAREVNHFMEANHRNMTDALNQILDLQEPRFNTRRR